MIFIRWQILLFGIGIWSIMAGSVYGSLSTNSSWLGILMDITTGDKLIITYIWIITSCLLIDLIIVWILFGTLTSYEIELCTERMTNYLISFFISTTSSYSEGNTILMVIFTNITFSCRFIHVILDNRTDLFTTRILNNLHEYTSRKQVALAFVVNPNFWISVLLTAFEYVAGAVLLYDIDEYQKLTLITFGFHFVLMTISSSAKVAKLLVMLHETTWYYTPSRNTEDQDFESDGVNAEAEVDDENEAEVDDENEAEVDDENEAEVDDENEAEVDDENEAEVDDENDELIWEAKTYYVKGIKITASFLELMANCRMMYLLYVFTKEFPLTCLGGIFFSLKAILKEIIHLRKYIIAANALETSIQNASKEDLAQGDNSCIVCFEIMFSVEEYDRKHPHKPLTKRRYPKKLLCGHILHMGCLKQWLERSDSCPMCRRKVMIGEALDTTASPPPQAQAQAQPVERPMAPQPTQQEPETNNSNEIVTITTTPPDPESIPNSAVDDKTILLTSTRTTPVDPLVVRVNSNSFLPKHWMALPLRRLNGTTTTTYEIQGTSGAFLQTNGDENNDP